jgi:hypothetical protein
VEWADLVRIITLVDAIIDVFFGVGSQSNMWKVYMLSVQLLISSNDHNESSDMWDVPISKYRERERLKSRIESEEEEYQSNHYSNFCIMRHLH